MSELLSTLQQGLGFLFGQLSWKRHLELTAVLRGEVIVVAVSAARRSVRTLVTLGDSTVVGVGDPSPGGGWRGVAQLLAAALGAPRHVNLSTSGARLRCVRERQLPAALQAAPDIALLVVGINDTMRSDFSPVSLHFDLDATVGTLTAAGSLVVTVRFHDHSRVFWLPGPLRRALRTRIAALNEIIDTVVARHGSVCVDLHRMPGVYDPAAWHVDRLHPSELGHRLLAAACAAAMAEAGWLVPRPVSRHCAGSRAVTAAEHVGWLIIAGIPWLVRRGQDLIPYGLVVLWRARRGSRLAGARDPASELGVQT
jgi:lysophospholipase L1-like esterase